MIDRRRKECRNNPLSNRPRQKQIELFFSILFGKTTLERNYFRKIEKNKENIKKKKSNSKCIYRDKSARTKRGIIIMRRRFNDRKSFSKYCKYSKRKQVESIEYFFLYFIRTDRQYIAISMNFPITTAVVCDTNDTDSTFRLWYTAGRQRTCTTMMYR